MFIDALGALSHSEALDLEDKALELVVEALDLEVEALELVA